jgi:hypothetical protein
MGGKGKGGVDAVDVDQDEALNSAADGATENADGAAQRLQEQHDQQAGFDAEGAHTLAVDRIEGIVDQTMLNSKELVFDIRDTILEIIKSRPKPWSGTSQGEQRDIAAAVENASKELVRKVVEAIASNGTASHRILLTKFNQSGTDMIITGKVKYHDEDEKHRAIIALSDSLNKHVMLTRASADDYVQGDREADTDPDEPGFGFEGDDAPSGDDDNDDDND